MQEVELFKLIVNIASSVHHVVSIIKWRKKGPGMEQLTKPKAIINYNAHMFGVDLMD